LYGYSWIQRNTAGYTNTRSLAKYKIETDIELLIYRNTRVTKDTVRYRRDTGKIQAGHPKNTRQGPGDGEGSLRVARDLSLSR